MRHLLATPLLAVLCLAPPAHAQFTAFMSPEEERKVGAEEHPKVLAEFGGPYSERRLDEYLAELGFRLTRASQTPQGQYTFTLLNSPVMNAMALPGGYVYITRGILALANNEAEVAGVVGHEIGHVTARHSAQRYSQGVATQGVAAVAGILGAILGGQAAGEIAANVIGGGGMLVLQKNSREHENEADQIGLRTLARAGYAPNAMPAFLQSLNDWSAAEARLMGRPGAEQEFSMLQTHPRTVDRVQATIREASLVAQDGRYGRDEFLDRIDGMMYGDDPEQGFIRDRLFAHPKLRIQFNAPPGFYLVNGSAAVSGLGPDNTRMVFDAEPDRNKVRSLADPATYIQRGWIGQQMRLQNIEKFTANGMNGATAAAQVKLKDGSTAFARFVALAAPGAMYRFQFIAPVNGRAKHDPLFRDAVMSFRTLSEAQAAALKPLRVRVVPVRRGDSEESLAARQPFGERNLDMFRTLNGLRANERIEAGQRAKVVLAE